MSVMMITAHGRFGIKREGETFKAAPPSRSFENKVGMMVA